MKLLPANKRREKNHSQKLPLSRQGWRWHKVMCVLCVTPQAWLLWLFGDTVENGTLTLFCQLSNGSFLEVLSGHCSWEFSVVPFTVNKTCEQRACLSPQLGLTLGCFFQHTHHQKWDWQMSQVFWRKKYNDPHGCPMTETKDTHLLSVGLCYCSSVGKVFLELLARKKPEYCGS